MRPGYGPGRRAATLSDIRQAKPTRLDQGGSQARQRAADVDGALAGLVVDAVQDRGPAAVVAVGGYGRGELSPHSDVDILILVRSLKDVPTAALKEVLYPFWDAGWQVGHAVRTPKDAVARAESDLHTATALLSARLVAGDEACFEELLDRRSRWLKRNARAVARRVLEAVAQRHRLVQRAGWSLAPDIKEDAGGLRDVHAAQWLCALTGDEVRGDVSGPAETLLAVREALHGLLRRKGDRIRIDLQPDAAARLGITGEGAANRLMAAVHTAARCIERGAWKTSEHASAQLLGGPRRSGSVEAVAPGVKLVDGRLVPDAPTPGVEDALGLLAAVAATGKPPSADALDLLAGAFTGAALEPWPRSARAAFLDILAGPHCPAALELLDHADGWRVLLPEWLAIRGRAQHDPYHRHTVDWHSFVAVSEIGRVVESDPVAAAAADHVGDLHTLRVAALVHDVGKGASGDHSVAGEPIARRMCARMGMSAAEGGEVAALVRLHLLLPDTATRRDLDDGAVIEAVAARAGSGRMLRLLYVLAVADGRATGPEAWSDWKLALVRELYRKALTAIETGVIPVRGDVSARAREVEAYDPALAGRVEDQLATLPPMYLANTPVPDIADEIRLLIEPPGPGEVRHRIDRMPGQPAIVTVCVPDRIGTLARTAGVLALHRLSVVHARAYSTSTGLALERFGVVAPAEEAWTDLEADLEAAYSGRLALEARVDKKVREYRAPTGIDADVRVLQDASATSTVVEVRAPDAIGLLYALTSAIGDLDLDIEVAKIDTLGERVVDVFYVRTAWGSKLNDAHIAELRRAIGFRVRRLFGDR